MDGDDEEDEDSEEELDDPNGTILAFRRFMNRTGRCYKCHLPGHHAAQCTKYPRPNKFPARKFNSSRSPSPSRFSNQPPRPSSQSASSPQSKSQRKTYPSPQRYKSPFPRTSPSQKPPSPQRKGNGRGGQ
jgi:hypothetical protein